MAVSGPIWDSTELEPWKLGSLVTIVSAYCMEGSLRRRGRTMLLQHQIYTLEFAQRHFIYIQPEDEG